MGVSHNSRQLESHYSAERPHPYTPLPNLLQALPRLSCLPHNDCQRQPGQLAGVTVSDWSQSIYLLTELQLVQGMLLLGERKRETEGNQRGEA